MACSATGMHFMRKDMDASYLSFMSLSYSPPPSPDDISNHLGFFPFPPGTRTDPSDAP